VEGLQRLGRRDKGARMEMNRVWLVSGWESEKRYHST